MSKKGVTQVIIWLILALIVVAIMAFLISRSSGTYIKSTSCENVGGKCLKAVECDGKRSFISGCKEDEVCCIKEGG